MNEHVAVLPVFLPLKNKGLGDVRVSCDRDDLWEEVLNLSLPDGIMHIND